MYTIDKFIGEFQTRINSFINKNILRQLIVSPTGTGKTFAIIRYADANPDKRIVLLCPTQSLVDNIQMDNPNLTCGYGAEFLSYNKTNNFIVTTYDSIEKIEDVDLYIVDEAHLTCSHSSFRDVIPMIFQTQTKVVFITATPEIIEDLFPKYNNKDYILEFDIHRTKKEVNIFTGKYNVKLTIKDIITNNLKPSKTILIRVNSKKVIDDIMQTFKPTQKDKIACIYSDEDNVLYQNQDKEKIRELKKGKISDLDFILCTSIYDVGLSFEVDRDIQCYAISQDNRCMPNAIDMVQLLARVRENSGYNMDLTIIGNYGDYEIINSPFDNYKSKIQLCNEMAHRYEQYSHLSFDAYIGILNYYKIDVTEIQTLGFETHKVKMASRVSDTVIAQNFNSFPEEYAIICGNLEYMGKSHLIKLITGTESVEGLKNNANVQRVYNILFEATKLEIDLDLFIGERFSVKRYDLLKEVTTNYTLDKRDIYSNLIRGVYSKDAIFNYKELGFNELNKSKQKSIRTLFDMTYKRGNFRGVKAEKILKKGVDKVFLEYMNNITCTNSMYSFKKVQIKCAEIDKELAAF
ncbi:DEAD/DEAH box helicase [Aurantibacter sp.]|uniref:DEAD/DEAH box helicase n=1 Tax=Aurantibacter sp. TaxID=2807103 RepID=UPI0035C7E2BF